jgi:hypothetical protein
VAIVAGEAAPEQVGLENESIVTAAAAHVILLLVEPAAMQSPGCLLAPKYEVPNNRVQFKSVKLLVTAAKVILGAVEQKARW